MPDIEVNVSYAGDSENIAVIAASGFIDTTTAPELEKKLEEQLALNKYKIIVNLENIDYVSSAGWGVFVSEIREIRENSGDLVLVNMSPDVYDVYELMEFSSILKSYDSLNEAIAGFSGGAPAASKPALQKPVPKAAPTASPAAKPAAAKPETAARPESQTTTAAGVAAGSGTDIYAYATSDLGKRIINVIIDNPYFEPKEISKALRLTQYGGQKARGGAVKKELKAMGLFDRQQRFELAMKSRG
jgi:anti-sigma B factor antagonist